jgi:hypothetical protein
MGLKVYNRLPAYLKERSYNVKKFKSLKKILYFNAFHTLEDYFHIAYCMHSIYSLYSCNLLFNVHFICIVIFIL